MASIIPTNISFLHPRNKPEGKQSSNSINTGEKTSTVVAQILSNATWYTELPASNETPVPGRLPLEKFANISAALENLQTKVKPPIPPRSDTTCLSPKPEHSDNQKFGSSLKNALTLGKKTPPIPLPRSNATCLSSTLEHPYTEAPVGNTPPLPPSQKNKPKTEPVSASLPLKRRVSFQENPDNPTINSPQILQPLPSRGILKKDLSFRNTEEKKPHNEADPFTETHNPTELNGNPNAKQELDLAMDELNAVLKNLGIAPVSNFPK